MSDKSKIAYGPNNPHPLSQMRTELVWEGKYDEFGNRREVNVANIAMPLQRIETIDEPRQRASAQKNLFDDAKAHRDDFRNRLIWGDNKLVMASLLSEFKNSIDLIYIDPPFDVGSDFTMSVPIGDEKEKLEKLSTKNTKFFFECTHCGFMTKYEEELRTHRLIHYI